MVLQRLKKYIDYKGISVAAFERSIGMSNASFGKSLKNGKGIGSDKLENILRIYDDLSPTWLLSGEGDMTKPSENSLNDFPLVEEPDKHPYITHIAPDKSCIVPITDISVAAGDGYLNHEHINELGSIMLPRRMMNTGKHLCVRVKGNSMTPTLHDSGYVIIRLIEKGDWDNIPNEHIYVVSDIEGRAFLKRTKNRFKKGFITLMSDNPDKATYPNFNLQFDEINTIWHVEWYISAKMPNIHDQYYSRLQALENRLDDMELKLLHKN